jgi:hypothetical protein
MVIHLCSSTVQRNDLSIDPFTLIAGKKHNDTRDIDRKAIPCQRGGVRCHLGSASVNLPNRQWSAETYCLSLFSRILLSTRNVVMRNIMEHVRDGATRCDRIHSDLFVTAVLGEDADERVDRAL